MVEASVMNVFIVWKCFYEKQNRRGVVCESGLVWIVVPGQIVGFGVGAGRDWCGSPYVVKLQIKKRKVSVVL